MEQRLNLKALADEALNAKNDGDLHAQEARQIDGISRDAMKALEARALLDPELLEHLNWAKEGREATFTNPFARASFFRLKIGEHATEERPNPEKVVSTLYSARAGQMWIRGQEAPQSAIPLFLSATKDEAHKQGNFLIVPKCFRRDQGATNERIGTNGITYLIASTAEDRPTVNKVRGLLRRMPSVLVDFLEAQEKYSLRDAAWLAAHLMPQARILTEGAAKNSFVEKDGVLTMKRASKKMNFVRFVISPAEHLLMEKSDLADRLIVRLSTFAAAATA